VRAHSVVFHDRGEEISEMHRAGKALTIAAVMLFGTLGAASIFVMTYDVNRLRPLVNDKVSEAIGRRFSIDGNMYLDWYGAAPEAGWKQFIPSPRLTAQNLQIGNPAWAAQPHFITLTAASVDFRLLPLLYKRLEITSVQLVQPLVTMERLADGRKSWILAPAASQGSAWKIVLGDIRFGKGTILISDAAKHIDGHIDIDSLGKPVPFNQIMQQAGAPAELPAAGGPPAYVFGFSVSGHYNNASISGSGMTGGVLPLTDTSRRFPLQVDARIGDTHITLAGTLSDPLHLALLDLQLQVSGTSASHLYAITGVALPDSPPFSSTGRLRGHFSPAGNTFDYDHFTARVGGSDLHGTMHYVTGGSRPKLSGNMASDLLRFSDLAPLIGSKPHPDLAATDAAPVAPQPANRALPVSAFRTDRWRHMDADVVYAAKQLSLNAALPIKELDVHAMLDDGVLSLQPLHFSTAGGSISGNIVLNGNQDPLRARLDMQVRKMQLAQMFPTIKQMQSSRGEVNGDIRLDATGSSIAAMAAGSNGEMKLLVEQGVVSRNLLELAGLNLPNIVVGKLFGDKVIPINCAAADLVVKDGQMDPRLFLVDTGDAQIVVNGTIDLAQEKLALDVTPHTHGLRILSLRAPLYISGTFKKPTVGVNVKRIALKGGIAIALGALLAPAAALLPLIAPGHRDDTECGKLILAMQKPSSATNPGRAAREINRTPKDRQLAPPAGHGTH
jgi:uncharacterized protein involved in outer membrane biogenesis